MLSKPQLLCSGARLEGTTGALSHAVPKLGEGAQKAHPGTALAEGKAAGRVPGVGSKMGKLQAGCLS